MFDISKRVYLFCNIFHLICASSAFLDIIADRIYQEPKLRQISLVLGSNIGLNSSNIDQICEKLTHQIPTFTISRNELNDIEDHLTSNKTSRFRHLRDSSLYLLFESPHVNFFQEINNALNAIVNINPIAPRPRVLVVLLGDPDLFPINIKNLFDTAWSLKFLEFSVLKVKKNDEVLISDYNPFDQTYRETKLNLHSIFFPDKLQNMNKFNVTTINLDYLPYFTISKNSNGILGAGMDYGFWKIVSEHLNFIVDYLEFGKMISDSEILDKLENNFFNITPITFLVGTEAYGKKVLRSSIIRTDEFGLIVPITYVVEFKNTLKPLINLSIFAGLMLGLSVLASFFKFSPHLRSPIYIFQLLLGITVSTKPKKRVENIIYLNLILLSIHYSSNIIASFTDNEILAESEMDYDLLKEVKEPSMTGYMNRNFFSDIEGDEVIRSIQKNFIKIDKGSECIRNQTKKKDRFCLSVSLYAKYHIDQNLSPDKKATVKIISPPLLQDFSAFFYEKGSPYAKKFDRKIKQILEAGIEKFCKFDQTCVKKQKEISANINFSLNASSDIKQLMTVLVFGYIFSVLAFIVEWVSMKSKNKSLCI